MTTTPGLSTEATGPSHPSLTVAFTLKVRFCWPLVVSAFNTFWRLFWLKRSFLQSGSLWHPREVARQRPEGSQDVAVEALPAIIQHSPARHGHPGPRGPPAGVFWAGGLSADHRNITDWNRTKEGSSISPDVTHQKWEHLLEYETHISCCILLIRRWNVT